MKTGQRNREANIWTARFIPLFLLAIIGYCSYVVTKVVCIDYLLNPAPSLLIERRTGPAIAILTLFYLLLLILLICYGRLVQTIITNPGLVPRGPQWYVEQERKSGTKKRRNTLEKEEGPDVEATHGYSSRRPRTRNLSDDISHSLDVEAANGDDSRRPRSRSLSDDIGFRVEDFWHKDLFVCNYDGRPRFCSTCYNYKPDRSHHCSELDRCVLKMDHFCPWVGGIVSETSFKYFIQFTFWTALFTLHTLVFMAYYFAERRRREDYLNVHWILVIALAGLFFIFGAGMCGSSLQFAFENTSTIENLSRRSKVYFLAVHVPEHILQRPNSPNKNDLRLISYPRPASEQFQVLRQHGAEVTESQQDLPENPLSAVPTAASPMGSSEPATPAARPPMPPMTRTFAILETKPGANPFDVGFVDNFREVMGYRALEWLSPLHASPLTQHDSPESLYRVGRAVHKLRREAGLVEDEQKRRRSSHRKKRRRRRSSAIPVGATNEKPRA